MSLPNTNISNKNENINIMVLVHNLINYFYTAFFNFTLVIFEAIDQGLNQKLHALTLFDDQTLKTLLNKNMYNRSNKLRNCICNLLYISNKTIQYSSFS